MPSVGFEPTVPRSINIKLLLIVELKGGRGGKKDDPRQCCAVQNTIHMFVTLQHKSSSTINNNCPVDGYIS